jgi:aminoglycoside 3-N-acetyltransferase
MSGAVDAIEREIAELVASLGVRRGDSLLVYSNVGSIAKIVDVRKLHAEFGAAAREQMLGAFHRALCACVGDEGTLMTLGSYTDYARYGKPFYVDHSLPDQSLGAYPRFLFAQPQVVRSYNPTSNIIAFGDRAADFAVRFNATAYGWRTPWEKLIEYEAKLLFWDTTLRPMTFGHHVEQCVGVPHVYSKLYDTPIYDRGHQLPFKVITSVRYLTFNVKYNMQRLDAEAKAAGLVKTFTRNTIEVDVVECAPLASFLTDKLAVEPYYLLDGPPDFVPGVVPFDGNAGPENAKIANVKYSPRR